MESVSKYGADAECFGLWRTGAVPLRIRKCFFDRIPLGAKLFAIPVPFLKFSVGSLFGSLILFTFANLSPFVLSKLLELLGLQQYNPKMREFEI